MSVQLMMVARYLLVVFAGVLYAHPPPVPALVLLLVAVGAAALVPAMRGLVRKVLRTLSSAAHGPPGLAPARDAHEVRVPAAPGARG
ncbi:MAG TPA: hypothetical protein VGF17_06085, partial [Phytomonospora sp.]